MNPGFQFSWVAPDQGNCWVRRYFFLGGMGTQALQHHNLPLEILEPLLVSWCFYLQTWQASVSCSLAGCASTDFLHHHSEHTITPIEVSRARDTGSVCCRGLGRGCCLQMRHLIPAPHGAHEFRKPREVRKMNSELNRPRPQGEH